MAKSVKKRQIILIMAIFVSSLVLIQNTSDVVSASSYIVYVGFEDGVVGNQYSNSTVTTQKKSGGTTFAVSSYNPTSGLKCFEIITSDGWFNLTYSKTNYLTNFTIYHKTDGANVGASRTYYFYNKSMGYTNPIIKIYHVILGNGTAPVYWYDGATQKWLDGTHFYATGYIRFNINNNLGEVRYECGISKKTGFACNSSQVNLGYRIDRIYIATGGVYTHDCYDNMNFIFYDSYSSAGPTTCDYTGFSSKGNNNAFMTHYTGADRILHQLYRVPINTTIFSVDLFIGNEMYSSWGIGADNSSDYYLTINGLGIGWATDITPYGTGYIVSWCGISVSITNEIILFEFEQSTKYSSYYGYWAVGRGSCFENSGDYDNDGTSQFASGISYGYGENVFCGDLAYKFYHGTIVIEPETSPYLNDNLTVSKTAWYIGDNIQIAYFVQQSLYQNYIQVWHNGTQITDTSQGYPKAVPLGSYSGEVSYVPLHIGNYQFRLVRNSIKIKSVNITVGYPLNYNYIVYTYPNPYDYNTAFNIGYIYKNPTGGKGLILLGTSQDMNSTSDAIKYWFISSNTSGNLTYIGTTDYYVNLLYSTDDVTFYYIDGVYQRLKNNLLDMINVKYATYTLSSPDYKFAHYKFVQTIFGTHHWLGFDVSVLLNGEFIGNVGSSNFYSLDKEISSANTYQAKLMLSTMNGTIELADVLFSVSGTTSPGPSGGNPWDSLLGDYKYLFAIGIIVMFLFLPMTVASRLGIELPIIVNVGTSALGLSFCILSGLLPLWTAFLTVVAIFVAGIFVMFGR